MADAKRPPLTHGRLAGLVIGGVIGAYPAFIGTFPFGSEAPNRLANWLGVGLVAGAVLQTALAIAILFRQIGDGRRAALILSGVMVFYAIAVLAATWLTNGFGTNRDLAISWLLGGPLLAIAGATLALGSILFGPNRAAVLVGDALMVLALAWPARPDGQPGILTVMSLWVSLWIVLAVIATWWAWTRGRQPWAAGLAILLISYLGAFPAIWFLFGQQHTPQVWPREWLSVSDEAGLVLIGILFLAAGVGVRRQRRPA